MNMFKELKDTADCVYNSKKEKKMKKLPLLLALVISCITLTSCEEKKVVNNNPPNPNQRNAPQNSNNPDQS